MDAHDKAARALDAEIRETLPPLLRPSMPLEDGLMLQIIAAALRKAAADERARLFEVQESVETRGSFTSGYTNSTRYVLSLRDEVFEWMGPFSSEEDAIRARAKGGA